MVDLHSHLIPGVDDGAATLDQALAALEEMQRQGVRHVITTPHFSASSLRHPGGSEYLSRVDDAWEELRSAAGMRFPELKLDRGIELALDEPLSGVEDARLRLAGGKFVLVEYPHFHVPPQSVSHLFQLRMGGLIPILAHPERYTNFDGELAIVHEWKRAGALLQVNAGSLVSQYGRTVQRTALAIVTSGLADYIASDFHAREGCRLLRARELLKSRQMEEHARLLMEQNPRLLVDGLMPKPVPRHEGEPADPRWRRTLRKFF